MKKYLLAFSIMVLSFPLFAQDNMEPEFVVNDQGRIVLNSGEELIGRVYFTFVSPANVYCFQEGQKRKRIKTKDVKEFFVNDLHFVKIKTPGIAVGSSEVIALQRTPEGFKIPIYETISQSSLSVTSNGKPVHKTDRTVYVHFPEHKTPRSIKDLSFTPFDKKVSKMVEDCQELSGKIANKEQGYRNTLTTSPAEQLEVFFRVSKEYQDCQ